jgi:predicted transcriptional regulator
MPARARDDDDVRRFVEHMAMVLNDWGFPRMPARVLMTMMSADEDALTAAELAERVEVSPAAISGAVRYLIHVGLLAREPVSGSRRDRYRLPDDTWYEASMAKNSLIKTVADLAEEGVGAVGGPATPSGARITEMREFFLFALAELEGLLERWRLEKGRAP